MMRITYNMMNNRVVSNLMTNAERLSDAQDIASSGKRIQKPSDDVSGTGRAMDLRSTITQIKQFLDNSTVVKNQLTVTNSALDTVVSSIERVRDIAMTAANASTTEESRTGLVAELDQIMGTLMTAGNTKNGEKYVFAGSKTTTQPIIESTDPATPYTYQGNDAEVSVRVTPWTSVTTNVTGDKLFNIGGAADSSQPDIFTAIQTLKQKITNNDIKGVSDQLDSIDENLGNVIAIRTTVGANLNRVNGTSSTLEDSKSSMSELLSDTEDADYTQAVLDLYTQQNLYQAAISTTGRLLQMSLADYLG